MCGPNCIYLPHVCAVPAEARRRRGYHVPWNWGYMCLWCSRCGWWEPNLSFLLEQKVFFPTKLPLQSQTYLSFSFKSLVYFIFYYVYGSFSCMHVYALCMYLVPWKRKHNLEFPRTGVRDSCELLCGCWELNSCPLEKQPLLLTAEPSQPPKHIFCAEQ